MLEGSSKSSVMPTPGTGHVIKLRTLYRQGTKRQGGTGDNERSQGSTFNSLDTSLWLANYKTSQKLEFLSSMYIFDVDLLCVAKAWLYT